MLVFKTFVAGLRGYGLIRVSALVASICWNDTGRYLSWTLNTNPLGATALPGKQLDLTTWNPEVFRKEANEVAVCLALDGRRRQPDFQAFAMCAIQRVA